MVYIFLMRPTWRPGIFPSAYLLLFCYIGSFSCSTDIAWKLMDWTFEVQIQKCSQIPLNYLLLDIFLRGQNNIIVLCLTAGICEDWVVPHSDCFLFHKVAVDAGKGNAVKEPFLSLLYHSASWETVWVIGSDITGPTNHAFNFIPPNLTIMISLHMALNSW